MQLFRLQPLPSCRKQVGTPEMNTNQSAVTQRAASIQNVVDGNMGDGTATCNFLDENARITMNLGHARPTSAPARMGTQALEYAQLQDGTQQFEEQKLGRVE